MQTKSLSIIGGLVTVMAVLLAGVAYSLGGRFYWRINLTDLERQFALATRNHDSGAVGEIARRIARLDRAPGRRLEMAESMVALRMFSDAEPTLASVLRDAPDRRSDVLRLRARSAAAQGKPDAAIAFGEEFLADPSVPAAARIGALDGIAAILVRQGQWERAQIRVDGRLALADGVAPRLLRAQIETRRRRWTAAAEDFHHLRNTSAADPTVKAQLPAWERVERALDELQARDNAVNEAPTAFRPGLERALLCMQLGLWQNAVDDLQRTSGRVPSADAPRLLIDLLRGVARAAGPDAADDPDNAAVPWLASSHALAGLSFRFNDQIEQWRALIALDERLTAGSEGEAGADEFAAAQAEHARLVCELGAPHRALVDVHALLQERPDFRPAQRVRVMALFAIGELGDAAAQIDAALKGQNDKPGATDPELARLAGLVWQAQGRHAQAVAMFTSCLSAWRRPDLLRARAKSLRYLQRFAEAEQDIVAAEALDPGAVKGVKP